MRVDRLSVDFRRPLWHRVAFGGATFACLACVAGCSGSAEEVLAEDEAEVRAGASQVKLRSATLPAPLQQPIPDEELWCPFAQVPRISLFDVEVSRGAPSVASIRQQVIRKLIAETRNDGRYALGAFCQERHPGKSENACAAAIARSRARRGDLLAALQLTEGGPGSALFELANFIEEGLGAGYVERVAVGVESSAEGDDEPVSDQFETSIIFDAAATRVLLVHWDTTGSC